MRDKLGNYSVFKAGNYSVNLIYLVLVWKVASSSGVSSDWTGDSNQINAFTNREDNTKSQDLS